MRNWLQSQWDNRWTTAQQWIISTVIVVVGLWAILFPPVWLSIGFGVAIILGIVGFLVFLVRFLIFGDR